jgi:uncharacterized membrane protein YphA (DoxX/SURF4 family)
MWDNLITPFIKKYYLWFGRIAFFIIYFYFGAIKIFSTSPAAPLVYALHEQTIPFTPFQTFYICFSLFEMLIGVLFLIPRFTRLVFVLFVIHIFTTMMPLIILPSYAWQSTFVPTLDGQYMIKNLILIALASSILVNTKEKK